MSEKRPKIGTRVEVTEAGYAHGLYPRENAPIYGTVLRHPRAPSQIFVRPDGRKTGDYYHVDFWRPAVESPTLEETLREVASWAAETFPDSTPAAKVAHLQEEVDELAVDTADAEEMADVVMIVSHLAAHQGIDLHAAIRAKLEKNRGRTWGPPDYRGVCRHIAE